MSTFIEIPDPRSPTVEFVRTPLRVVKMIIDEENIPTDSVFVSDTFVSASPIDAVTSTPMVNDTDESFHSAIGESDTEPLITSMNISNVKENTKKPRRALGCIKNRLIETPKTDMRRKLWRNMGDERVKKGVKVGIENTPPFMDITASAPPKLYGLRKHGQVL